MEQYITSSAGAGVKRVKRLMAERAFRRQENAVTAEGERLIADLPEDVEISVLYIDAEKKEKYTRLAQRAKQVIYCTSNVMRALSDTATPCGVLAVTEMPHKKFKEGALVIADGVSDPGNLGAVIRTAAACGAGGVLAVEGCDVFSPKVVRASMGGVFRVPLMQIGREELGEYTRGYKVFALDMHGENVYNMKKEDFSGRFALAVGGEAFGLSAQVREAAERIISLPMSGDMESLNAAVSLSVALYTVLYALK